MSHITFDVLTAHQDDKGGLVVEPEDVVVDADGVELDVALDGAKDVKHFLPLANFSGQNKNCKSKKCQMLTKNLRIKRPGLFEIKKFDNMLS